MHRPLIIAILFCHLLLPTSSWGMNFYIPQGHREALMANTGISLSASEGAAIYNPAGAGGLESSRVSAGGSLLNASVFKFNNGNSSNFNDKSTSPSYTQIPGLITGYQNLDWGRAGFFINTDYMISLDKLLTGNASFGTYYMEIVSNLTSLNMGLIYAQTKRLTDDWRFQYGLTVSLNMLEMQQSLFNKNYVSSTNTYTSHFSNQNVKTINALTRIGTLLVNDDFSIGAYYQPKGGALSSSNSTFAYQVASTGSVVDTSTNEGSPLLTPETYGLGVSMSPTKSLRLFLDGNVVAPGQENTSISGNERNESLGLGVDYGLASGNHLYGGLTYTVAKGDGPTKGWLLSSGFDYKTSFIKNYVGTYYASHSTTGRSRGSDATFSCFGIIIASQYAF